MKKTRILLIFLFVMILGQVKNVKAFEPEMLAGLQTEIAEYIKPWQGNVSIRYQNILFEDESYSLNGQKVVPAASTIKLPLALFVMKLADQGILDLSTKLTYKSHHYYGGSGVIQNDKLGSSYTIEDLVEKAMVYSDNIAFIMLKEHVGQGAFIEFLESLGASQAYPDGRNMTSADDLILYAKEVYRFSKESIYGEKLLDYLQNTIYNTTIPQGIPNKMVAHKVGMIPKELIYNDVAVVLDHEPYVLSVTTKGIGYEESQKVIADIANIIDRHHELLVNEKAKSITVEVQEAKLQSGFTSNLRNKTSIVFKVHQGLLVKYPWVSKSSFEFVSAYQKLQSVQNFAQEEHLKLQEAWAAALEKTKNEPIRLTFAGDAMMDWSVKETVKQKGPEYPFMHIKQDLLLSDLSIVNLETAITTRGQKYPKEYNFRSDPTSLRGLKSAGFQLVSLANNHSFDYGPTGFRDTIDNLKEYQLDYVGGGINKQEAYAAKTYAIKGRTIKVLAFSRVLPDFTWVATDKKPGLANGYDLALIQEVVKKEKKDADFLFVYIHWGVETKRTPESFQRSWAKTIIDSGADGVIGSHPHVLQGFEYYKDKPIAYSLGNFLFPNYIKGDKAQTGLLHLEIINEKINMAFVPYKIVQDQIVTQTDNERRAVWSELQALSFGGLNIEKGIISNSTMVAEAEE